MFRRLLYLTLIGAVAAMLLRSFIIEGIYAASASMEPTLHVGTYFFLEKVSIKFRPPRRKDIIVFPSPDEAGHDVIKRVIAVGGDILEIKDKAVYINGSRLTETYVQYTRVNERLVGDNLGPLSVPQGYVFVMGDNRDESKDSRDWKNPKTGEPVYFIPVKAIKGAILQFY